jgi:hypothetical protein
VGLDGEHQGRLDRAAIDEDRAGAADRVLAPKVCTGDLAAVAKQVSQRPPDSTTADIDRPLTSMTTVWLLIGR